MTHRDPTADAAIKTRGLVTTIPLVDLTSIVPQDRRAAVWVAGQSVVQACGRLLVIEVGGLGIFDDGGQSSIRDGIDEALNAGVNVILSGQPDTVEEWHAWLDGHYDR